MNCKSSSVPCDPVVAMVEGVVMDHGQMIHTRAKNQSDRIVRIKEGFRRLGELVTIELLTIKVE